MNTNLENQLNKLFKSWSTENAIKIIPLPKSGSNRKYFRLIGKSATAIAVLNKDQKENKAFISFAKTFFSANLPVPQILGEDLDNNIYLQKDLGDQSLFDLLLKEGLSPKVENYYRTALSILLKFQIEAAHKVDYSVCYPRDKFDEQSVLWDLNYFKYYFLKLANIQFDEQKLEEDFRSCAILLSNVDWKYFMYRDFQSRNIMIKDEELFFIDFQGGRKGALQYDVASLLWSARANLPFDIREKLLDHYLTGLKQYKEINEEEFKSNYYGFVLIRILQTLGAYGYRGFYERKEHFLKSIPFAIDNLEWLIENQKVNFKCDELLFVLVQIIKSDLREKYSKTESEELKISITSFSYKDGVPYDKSGNGGGFVFDCRAIHNPGRYDEYKMLTGKNEKVIEFLEQKSDADKFLKEVWKILLMSIKDYRQRGFKNLMVNFGCTGGQHRSVYCAEKTARYFKTKPNLFIELNHTALDKRVDL